MPSFSTYISIIDTKEWAVNVLEDVLSDNPPIAFEPLSPPCYPDEKHESSSWINHPLGNDDGLHRSLSLPDDESYCSEDLRSPSFSIPSATHSDPGTLPSIVNGFHVAKLSSFKRRLSFKRLLFSSEALLYRSTCWKVQKGLEIWRSTLESSMEQKEPIEKVLYHPIFAMVDAQNQGKKIMTKKL
ncbi:uncharacterized protein BYT42DRAFT_230291 [Radiomyces spectabilis]|uniref:uncharacterized protein n=1 Tax=Radiomyces spectabilis TaxID=64574 RepID=UPI00221F448F|nr:uncharacterized protein BYT42DRAFT_230291 [Radiomyces spectabilis]KAI8388320.1 hypothetical protein BYT42DRAFT_230291 [Radiomyces spectabilis]